ncbi:PDC sensor domain-containing protein [Pontibacter locisalis]|uniref:PDC sensor domain-containing protein n=1 Tax=Pontibacter locisalis TaxID=1719035 RepID=A0ABW5IF97_9BACT
MDNTDTQQHRTSAKSSGENGFVKQLKKPVVFIPLLLLLVVLGVYLYKESQLKEARREAAEERALLLERANERIAENRHYLLEVVAKPFSWALRSALLTGNVEQVNQYLFQFVQEEKFAMVLVADAEGNIISSTDQNFTGSAFADHFDSKYLQTDATTVDDSDPERVIVASPIMGLNSRLGTLLVVYRPDDPLQLQELETEE